MTIPSLVGSLPSTPEESGDLSADIIDTIAEQAIAWAEQCGALAIEAQRGSLTVEYKGKGRRDPVTDADRAVETRIRQLVAETFPEHGVLGEETAGADDVAATAPAVLWVVDPIDGTANFACGLPFWAISIGVLHRGRPIAGVIWTPIGLQGGPTTYHARRGGGAYAGDQPIRVSANDRPEPAAIIGVPGYWARAYTLRGPLRKGPGEPRVLGSIAIELALTASGVMQYSIYGGPKIWDAAAGVVIVQEAGGVVLAQANKRWQPLDRFSAPTKKPGPGLPTLADWRMPLIVANPAMADFLAQHLRRRFSLRLWLTYWWRRTLERHRGRHS